MSELELVAGADANADVSSPTTKKRKRVLLIEDDPLTRLILLSKLRIAGLDVDVAVNGTVAMQKLPSGHPDAIFLDLTQPEPQGVEVIKGARRDPEFGDRPIYVCTSAPSTSPSVRKTIKAGATKVFNKMISPVEDIVAEVASDLIGDQSARDQPTPADRVESEALKELPAKLKENAAWLCTHLQLLAECNDNEARAAKCRQLWSKVHSVASCGIAAGMPDLARQAAALQTFLKELCEQPKRFTESSLRTVSSAIETLELLSRGPCGEESKTTEFTAVVVDDELFSRTATNNALRNAGFRLITFSNPDLALDHLKTQAADLIVLDLLMPKLSGMELCKKLRKLSLQKQTPVIFVASPGDLRNSARELSTHGVELVVRPYSSKRAFKALNLILKVIGTNGEAKPSTTPGTTAAELVVRPFASMELALKALSLALKRYVQNRPLVSINQLMVPTTPQSIQASQDTSIWLSVKAARAIARKPGVEKGPSAPTLIAPNEPIETQPPTPAAAPHTEAAPRNLVPEIKPDPVAALEVVRLQSAQSELQKQLKAIAAEAALHRDALASSQHEREELVARICSDELGLNRARTALDQAGEERKRLEQKLQELTEAKTDLEKDLAEVSQSKEDVLKSSSQFLDELMQAKAAVETAEAALKEEAARNKGFEERLRTLCSSLKLEQSERTLRFEKEVADLKEVRDDLQNQLTAEQKAVAESATRVEAMEERLRDSAGEVERVKAELETQTAEQQRLEAEWRERLETAEAISKKLETAWQDADERNKCFAAELSNLRKIHDELKGKLIAEELAGAESKWRVGDLEARLGENSAELERVKAELEKGRNEQVEKRLTNLHQVHDELSGELKTEQQATVESKQRSQELEGELRATSAELERIKSDAEKQSGDQTRLESELNGQLQTAKAGADQAETAFRQKAAQCSQAENELAGLRQTRDELSNKLTSEQQAVEESKRSNEELRSRLQENSLELERVKADSDKHAEGQARLETELRAQLTAAQAAAEQAEAAFREEAARNKGFDERLQSFGNSLRMEQIGTERVFEYELTTLRQLRNELQEKLATEQRAVLESSHQAQELEGQLQESLAELERARAELAQHTADGGNLKSDLLEKLRAANTATEQAEAARLEEAGRNKHFEQEVARLCQLRDELQQKLAAEQKAGDGLRKSAGELENQLVARLAELDRAQAEFQKQTADQARSQSELSQRLDAAKAATEKAETARLQESERSKGFENGLATLRQVRDELQGKLATEQGAAADSRKSAEELQNRLRENIAELERARAGLGQSATERERVESDLREQLIAARAAAEKAEATWLTSSDQNKSFETELTALRQLRDELHAKLAAEQQSAAQLKSRSEELENRLQSTTAELERTRVEAEAKIAARAQAESALEEQLKTAKAASEKVEATWRETGDRNRQFEGELASLRQLRDELQSKLAAEQQAAGESARRAEEQERRLRENIAGLEQSRAELEKQAAERRHSESDLSAQLEAARAATQQAEAARLEEVARHNASTQELTALRQVRDELQSRLTAEQQAAAASAQRAEEQQNRLLETVGELTRLKADAEKLTLERTTSESDLSAQLEAARAATEKAEAARLEEVARHNASTQELTALRQVRDELQSRLTAELSELTRLKADAEKLTLERTSQSELSTQINAAKAAAEQSEVALQQKLAELRRAEQEVENLRQERHVIYDKFMAEHRAAAKSERRSSELEKQLERTATGFTEAKAELKKKAEERALLESTLRAEIDAAKEAVAKASAAHKQEFERAAGFEQQSALLSRTRDELAGQLAAEQERAALSRQRTEELESRAAELGRARAIASLARVTADLEKERGERHRAEQRSASLAASLQQLHEELKGRLETEGDAQKSISDLEQRLRETEETLARMTANLDSQTSGRRLAEEQLRALGDMSAQLQKYVSLFANSKGAFKRTRDELGSKLETCLKALNENQAKLQQESSERQRLEHGLAAAQQALQHQTQQNAVALALVQSELEMEQFERKRLESDALQSFYGSVDSARMGHSLVNDLSSEIRQPIDSLTQSTRRLLELDLDGEQRKLLESVLENALSIHASLSEPGAPAEGMSEAA